MGDNSGYSLKERVSMAVMAIIMFFLLVVALDYFVPSISGSQTRWIVAPLFLYAFVVLYNRLR